MPETTTEKRKPGRPKGYPRSGGRAKGTANKSSQLGRDFIIKLGAPIETLCNISKGEKVQAAADTASAAKRNGIYPTIDQRLTAARILAAKVVPDQKAVEIGGPMGEPLSVKISLGA